MTCKNHFHNLRLSADDYALLGELAEALEMPRSALARALLHTALRRLKADSIKAGGVGSLEFSFKAE